MRRTCTLTVIVTVFVSTLLHAQTPGRADVQFRAAQHKEEVEGDLKAAIQLYRKIAEGPDRALAARALVRMADCYEKIGSAEAKRVYERLVHDYADQPEAVATARGRLSAANIAASPAIPAGPALRKLWEIFDLYVSNVSSDGKVVYASFNFPNRLFIRDLTTGSERPVASEATDGKRTAYPGVLSQDGALVVYNSCLNGCQIRSLTIGGDAPQPSRIVVDHDAMAPLALSADKTLLAVSATQADQTTQIRVVSMADGTGRVLKSLNWRGTEAAFFSPDGRWLLYDAATADGEPQRDIFIIAVDGSRETPVPHPSDDRAVGWSPDGRSVLFTSDRRGVNDLWRLPLRDGRPSGSPELSMTEIGAVEPRGVSDSGTLYMIRTIGGPDVETISLDVATGRPLSPASRPIATHTGFNRRPAWSPDGHALAYLRDADKVMMIHSFESGKDRELTLQPALTWMSGPAWSPDSRQIAVIGNDLKGRHGAFRIEVSSGTVTPIVITSSTPFAKTEAGERLTYEGPMWSPDGARLYYHKANGAILEWTLATATEREVGRGFGNIGLSPDGQLIATSHSGSDGVQLVIVPVAGGAPRVLWRLGAGEWINNTSIPWMPDGRSVLARKMLDANGTKSELWLVPVDGGAPRKLDFDATRIATFANGRISLHPDGRQLAYLSSGRLQWHLMVLENAFAPLTTSRRR